MTLLEYVQSLQEQGATDIPDKVQEWKKKNQPEAEKEVVETPVEEVKPKVVAGEGASAATTPEASESSSSGSGESVSQEPRFFGPGMTDKEMDQARKSQKQ
ncbi:unnamed protein product, partial [marine sediment metagenome]